jgi:energy-coupling factor transporter transmembrane protein EcfT
MAQRIVLHYFPESSPLHRWDARCKVLALFLVTLSLVPAKAALLLGDMLLLAGLILLSRLPWKRFVGELRLWGLFLLVIFLFQALFTPGNPWSGISWLPVTREGIFLGGFACWRIALILGYGILFTAVTRPREVQEALFWFLKPFPFLPARRIGLMVSLTLRFFSVILDQSDEVRLAHRARLGDRCKNPLRRARFLAFPVLRRSFARAEDVTLALAARGYRDDIPVTLRSLPLSHLIPAVILGVMILLGLAA